MAHSEDGSMDHLVEVTCPHCGAHGRVMLPVASAIVIGPCPRCSELVCIFCGSGLPLRKEIILSGSDDEKREHLLEVLVNFLEERIGELVEQMSGRGFDELTKHLRALERGEVEPGVSALSNPGELIAGAITKAEIERFIDFELPRLDNADYFKGIFEGEW